MASASVPAIPTLVFTNKAVPCLHINGYVYKNYHQPSLLTRHWYCKGNKPVKCEGRVSTASPLYNLESPNTFYSPIHNHQKRSIRSFSTQCIWILYKYYFSTFPACESTKRGFVVKGEVSSISQMLELPDMNNIMNDDNPGALGRFQYSFFQKDISPDWTDNSQNQSRRRFILLFRKPSEVTRESLYGYWRVLLTCIMQGTFGTYTKDINGATVCFCGNTYHNPPLPPNISVWTSFDFTPPEPEAPPPILGEMLRKLFEPLVDVQYLRHDKN